MLTNHLPKSYTVRWYDAVAPALIKKQSKTSKKSKVNGPKSSDIQKPSRKHNTSKPFVLPEKKTTSAKKEKRIENNLSLMRKRIHNLRKFATEVEIKLNITLARVFGKNSFIFQKGFLFTKANYFYIVDFYFPEQNLILEVDGGYHNDPDQIKKDLIRENTLKETQKAEILRFSNEHVLSDISNVITQIKVVYVPKKIETKKDLKKRIKCNFCNVMCRNIEKVKNHMKASHKQL